MAAAPGKGIITKIGPHSTIEGIAAEDFSDYLKQLEDEMLFDPIPEGWHDVHEFCEIWGISHQSTRVKLYHMVRIGKAERKSFYVLRDGIRRKIPYYKVKEEKDNV